MTKKKNRRQQRQTAQPNSPSAFALWLSGDDRLPVGYVFCPLTGTMPAGGKTETVQYTGALDLSLENLNLEIISVDKLAESGGVVAIG